MNILIKGLASMSIICILTGCASGALVALSAVSTGASLVQVKQLHDINAKLDNKNANKK